MNVGLNNYLLRTLSFCILVYAGTGCESFSRVFAWFLPRSRAEKWTNWWQQQGLNVWWYTWMDGFRHPWSVGDTSPSDGTIKVDDMDMQINGFWRNPPEGCQVSTGSGWYTFGRKGCGSSNLWAIYPNRQHIWGILPCKQTNTVSGHPSALSWLWFGSVPAPSGKHFHLFSQSFGSDTSHMNMSIFIFTESESKINSHASIPDHAFLDWDLVSGEIIAVWDKLKIQLPLIPTTASGSPVACMVTCYYYSCT